MSILGKVLLGIVQQFKDEDGAWRDCPLNDLDFYVSGQYENRKLFIYTESGSDTCAEDIRGEAVSE